MASMGRGHLLDWGQIRLGKVHLDEIRLSSTRIQELLWNATNGLEIHHHLPLFSLFGIAARMSNVLVLAYFNRCTIFYSKS